MIINLWFTIALIIVMIAFVAMAVCWVVALAFVIKAAKEAGDALEKVNKVSGKIADITDRMSSPLMSAVSVAGYVLSSIAKKKRRCRED